MTARGDEDGRWQDQGIGQRARALPMSYATRPGCGSLASSALCLWLLPLRVLIERSKIGGSGILRGGEGPFWRFPARLHGWSSPPNLAGSSPLVLPSLIPGVSWCACAGRRGKRCCWRWAGAAVVSAVPVESQPRRYHVRSDHFRYRLNRWRYPR